MPPVGHALQCLIMGQYIPPQLDMNWAVLIICGFEQSQRACTCNLVIAKGAFRGTAWHGTLTAFSRACIPARYTLEDPMMTVGSIANETSLPGKRKVTKPVTNLFALYATQTAF